MPSPLTAKYDWILAITTIAFVFSAFGNGANDVANSYATSVAARTLTMPQVGFLSVCTEFAGAVGLGARVTSTIKNGIISIDRFRRNGGNPGALMLAMGCAEVGSATWLMFATGMGMPVSTTQTVVGALIGVGFASGAPIKWSWESGSVSQVAASWAIAPLLAGAFSALVFATLKYGVLERADPFLWAMRLIPFYFALTGAILALFIVVEAPTAPSLEEFGAGKAVGIILGVFFGCLLICYVFFVPFFKRKLVMKDPRVRIWHVILGPMLLKEDVTLFWPGKGDEYVTDYYKDAYGEVLAGTKDEEKRRQHQTATKGDEAATPPEESASKDGIVLPTDPEKTAHESSETAVPRKLKKPEPYERFIGPVKELSWANPQKWWGYFKFCLLQGVTRDVISHDSDLLRAIHSKAKRYDIRVEHLWTYCQVVSAMMMSIAHGSNDVANAVGPWAAVYQTYKAGAVATRSPTPVWFLVVAGLLLGLGFWFYGYHIMRALGNKITQMSPTRGFSIELGAAITVLLASRLGLPVSTTQCLTGSALGVALMNYDLGAVNWRQLAFIFMGWVLTLPAAGLVSGLLCVMALNTPHF
ncbi:phosphate-repressible phosphate permease-like protein [Lentithecium fluviatile CBS 122367]|uniref:Phosphate transporter n=1 Tax=Lentithecium fluviatile CBS 122367 TaxID=1168545 RepID=A0A6G1J546_9PLEO|nr:phosphate-repressible phosphate permease-like protein [Lentithecium fluviatile CBS 122367]